MGKLSIWTLSNEDVGDPSRSVGVNEFVDSGERENKRIGHHREKKSVCKKKKSVNCLRCPLTNGRLHFACFVSTILRTENKSITRGHVLLKEAKERRTLTFLLLTQTTESTIPTYGGT
jgi:hypothetical protein